MRSSCIIIIGALMVSASSAEGEGKQIRPPGGQPLPSVEDELRDLFEMVPAESLMSLAVDYALADSQLASLLAYLTGPVFKERLLQLESSEEFLQLADVADVYHVDAYAIANHLNSALDMPRVKAPDIHRGIFRRRRSPGDGVAAFLREAVASLPLDEMREEYQYKMEKNPQFKRLMDRIVGGDATPYLKSLLSSGPGLETRRDLEELGLNLTEISGILEGLTTQFFSLEATTSSSSTISLLPSLPPPTSSSSHVY